jgi:hypothetical protein
MDDRKKKLAAALSESEFLKQHIYRTPVLKHSINTKVHAQ